MFILDPLILLISRAAVVVVVITMHNFIQQSLNLILARRASLQRSRLEIRLNAFHRLTIPQKQFINIIIIIIIIIIITKAFQKQIKESCYEMKLLFLMGKINNKWCKVFKNEQVKFVEDSL